MCTLLSKTFFVFLFVISFCSMHTFKGKPGQTGEKSSVGVPGVKGDTGIPGKQESLGEKGDVGASKGS